MDPVSATLLTTMGMSLTQLLAKWLELEMLRQQGQDVPIERIESLNAEIKALSSRWDAASIHDKPANT